jgi:hypothetical protein
MINSPVESWRGLTASLTNGLLVAGTTSTLTTTVTIVPVLDGKFTTTLTAITNQAHPTTDFNTLLPFVKMVGGNSVANTPGQGCVVVYGLSAGVVKAVQGPIRNLDMQGNFQWDAPQFPAMPANFVPFAYAVLKAGATAATSIVVGTDNWAATGFTQAFVNIAQIPSRPQVA